ERRRREVEPIIETIARCRRMVAEGMLEMTEDEQREAAVYQQRLKTMDEFLSAVNSLLNLLLASRKDVLGQLRAAFGLLPQ
ncbi:MAG: hypothetical protein HY718_06605, partial [Planctomycetes bacterium]|nr:hypothetical protein [Planctomycetota bacterium]